MTPSAMPFAPLTALARAVLNYGVDPSRVHILALLCARYMTTEPLRLAALLTRGARSSSAVAIPPRADPIFVLGHWRSGTSHLQTLLADDPAHTTTTLFRSLFSDLPPGAEAWLEPVLDAIARGLRLQFSFQRMPLRLGTPAEFDIGLCARWSSCSYSFAHLFPRHFDRLFDDWVLKLDDARAQAWLVDLGRFIDELSAASGGRRVVVKSPGDTARLRWLAARYPEARFVYIHRDPIEVYHSCHYFWRVVRREYSLHRLSEEQVQSRILATYPRLLEAYLDQRDPLLGSRLVEVSHSGLRDDPAGTLDTIYRSLDLGEIDAERMARLRGAPRHVGASYPNLPDLERKLRKTWAIGFREWRHLS